MSGGAALRHPPSQVVATDACCSQYFRTVGSPQQLHDSLRRLQRYGWQVLSAPEPGPFDTWSVRVRHPRGCLHGSRT